MHPLEQYLTDVRLVYASGAGTPETSHYNALGNLLNEVGRQLKPRVHAVIQLQNRGAGMPDGGLFTADQLNTRAGEEPLPGNASRGVIEVKGIGDDAFLTAEGEQVTRYFQRHQQVLVTNLRDFVLVASDDDGNPIKMETYRLAESEDEFREACRHPRKTADEQGDRFIDFLKRVMLHSAPLTSPEDLAWLLAAHAREALARTEVAELDRLKVFREDLEESLGLTFEGERGDHFFRSTLVQTLFYGIFSAWVLWNREQPRSSRDHFRWREAHWHLRVPMVRALFYGLAEPSRLTALDLAEVLDWTGMALNRVDRSAFFQRFENEAAVQHFYEPFLAAFDPVLRKQLGVWYTPSEVVEYMVERVDTVLRQELGLPDGLADERVYVLDPCTGTGSYLVQVLKKINQNLTERGGDALTASDVKQATLNRVFGFEIMPAPFVIAHMQIGLYLQELGVPLSDDGRERAGVFLTNALTGWEEPDGPQQRLEFPELEIERDAAEKVKRETPILVVIGNPPYNGYAGLAIDEERDLVDAYRSVQRVRRPQGQGLNDLYVRFFRMAERRIVEMTGSGVVCYISNYSWLDGLSFTGMRERYLDVFDTVWIDSLNGDKYRTGKLTPEGDPDPSIFSTDWNREGIQVGTAITLAIRNVANSQYGSVHYRSVWGRDKWQELKQTARHQNGDLYEGVEPSLSLGLPFTPMRADAEYELWPKLPDLFPISYPGVKTSRDELVVDIDRERLIERMRKYFDTNVSHEEMRRISPSAMTVTTSFPAEEIRSSLQRRGFLPEKVIRYCYRPFDVRWLYWEPETKLLDRKREEYFPQVFGENRFIVSQQKVRREWSRPQVVRSIGCLDLMDRGASCLPMMLGSNTKQQLTLDDHAADTQSSPPQDINYNVTVLGESFLMSVSTAADPFQLFYHSVSVLHSLEYRLSNDDALRQDWPRIPLPDSKELLERSAALGRRVADLLDPEKPVEGVTMGVIRPELRVMAGVHAVGDASLDPDRDLELTAGWGYRGQRGVVMPGGGRIDERDYTAEEWDAIFEGAEALGIDPDEAFNRLGETTIDVYLNERAYWRNVPVNVWSYTIGGYQVIKKWLSYRESKVLGRPMRLEEAREVQFIARRIAALLLLEPELDANYQAVKASVYPWPGEKEKDIAGWTG